MSSRTPRVSASSGSLTQVLDVSSGFQPPRLRGGFRCNRPVPRSICQSSEALTTGAMPMVSTVCIDRRQVTAIAVIPASSLLRGSSERMALSISAFSAASSSGRARSHAKHRYCWLCWLWSAIARELETASAGVASLNTATSNTVTSSSLPAGGRTNERSSGSWGSSG